MSSTNADLIVRLRNARQARRDAQQVAGGVREIGSAARTAGALASAAGRQIDSGMSLAATGARRGAVAVGLLGLAGAKMGLQYDAALENSEGRFELFTDSVAEAHKVLEGVQGVDLKSSFDLATLANAAAYLGNAEISASKIPRYIQGIANAASAAGGGNDRLERIATALGQIQSKGKLSAEEVQQLAEAGVNVRSILQREFHLSGEQVADLGNQAIDANKALDAIIANWTSGKMATAAARQTTRLSGQWDLLTGNVQKVTGAMTLGLAGALRDEVLPAANEAATRIQAIFEGPGSVEDKVRRAHQVIKDEFGPIAAELEAEIKRADLGDKLADGVETGLTKIADAAVHAAPGAAEAFVNAWLDAGTWTKVLTAGVLAKKLGAFGAAGRLIGQQLGGKSGIAGAVGKAGAVPVWVTNPGFGGTGPGGGKGPLPVGTGTIAAAAAAALVILERDRAAREAGVRQTVTGPTFAPAADPKAQVQANAALGWKVLGLFGIDKPGPEAASLPSTADPFRRPPLGPVFPAGGQKLQLNAQLMLPDGRVLAELVDEVIATEKARR